MKVSIGVEGDSDDELSRVYDEAQWNENSSSFERLLGGVELDEREEGAH